MKFWFDEGFHAVIGSTHLLFDPTNYFDPHPNPGTAKKPDIVLVSHGHADHSNIVSRFGDTKKIMHRATHDIMSTWHRIKNVVFLQKKERAGEGESPFMPIKFKGLVIEAFNSGHCVGSVQFKVTSKEGTFVFTGDINSTGTKSMKAGDILEADVLAIESTMGHPSLVSPERMDGYRTIYDFLKKGLEERNVAVLYGHAIGKGQELTMIMNSFADLKIDRIYVGTRAFNANMIYEKYVLPLGRYTDAAAFRPDQKKTAVFLDLYKLVTSKKTAIDRLKLDFEPPSMIVSAFTHGYEDRFPTLKLSSHDDWNGLNNYVDKSIGNRKGKIITFHGQHDYFSKHLKKRGYDAVDSHAELLRV